MNAVVQMFDHTPRSLVEKRAIRPPTIGKIRPGIKVLTRANQANEKAVKLYNDMVAAGDSFEAIGKTLETSLKLRNALIPKNVDYFVCRRSDFSNPDTADEILRLYGEDRGNGVKLYRFPVMFAFDDWLRNVPNQMAAYTTAGRQYFSEYDRDGKRYCKTYAPVERNARAQRARRSFGGRLVVHRQDDDIPDGICDPHVCPQYGPKVQSDCQLHVRGARRQRAGSDRTADQLDLRAPESRFRHANGCPRARSTHLHTLLALEEKVCITRVDDNGQPVRQKQMLTVLDADIDLGALLDGAEAGSRHWNRPVAQLRLSRQIARSERWMIRHSNRTTTQAGTRTVAQDRRKRPKTIVVSIPTRRLKISDTRCPICCTVSD